MIASLALVSLLASSALAGPFSPVEKRATVSVHFTETSVTTYGENIFIAGSIPALGNWAPSSSVALDSANYPNWDVTLDLPANTTFQYKFIRKESDGRIVWENDPNRSYTTGASGSANVTSSFNGPRGSSSSSSSVSASSSASASVSASSSAPSAQSSGSVTAMFSEQATPYFGENIYLVGSLSILGTWNTNNAILLSSANYPTWTTNVSLPANTTFQFKFIRKAPDGSITWENDPNRQATTPASGNFVYRSSFNGPAVSPSGSASASSSASVSASVSASSVSSSASASQSAGTVSATFYENATTNFGQNIYIVGSIGALGNWNTDNAILLSSASYPTWKKTLTLPANTNFQFKFIRKESDGRVTWENDPNRQATTPASGDFVYTSSFNGPAVSASSSGAAPSSSSA